MTDWAAELRHPNWAHQAQEFETYRDSAARALHWQMRTGKTKAMIDLACYLYRTGKIDGVLIAAPNNVHANWPRKELPKHHWLTVPYVAMTWSSEDSKRVQYDFDFTRAVNDKSKMFWFAVNAEAMAQPRAKEYIKAFCKRRRFLLITDETHDWRRASSKRSTFLRNTVARKAVARRNLSGTMVENSPFHAYAQFEILEKGALGFTTVGDFEQFFGVWEKDTIYIGGRAREIPKCTGYRNQDILRERMAQWTSYVYRDQVDDMPDLVEGTLEFELTGQQKRVYNELARGGLVKLDSGEYLGEAEGGVLITRLQQVASGWIVDEDGEVHSLMPVEENPRLQALRSELALAGHKTVIWCRYREDVVRVRDACKSWGYKPVDYYGGTPKKLRPVHEDRFQRDPTCGPMVANAQTCGQGLDFSAGGHMVYYSHTHGDLIGRKQSAERCTVKGGRSIGVTDLVARGTVDEKILADQDRKVQTTEYLTGDGLRRYLETVL